jgi:hypothetical protein
MVEEISDSSGHGQNAAQEAIRQEASGLSRATMRGEVHHAWLIGRLSVGERLG